MTVTADGKATELAAKHIIIATGARARELPFAKADGKRIWTYRHAMTPAGNAERIAGHRLGRDRDRVRQFLQRSRRKVTVVEMLDRIVPVEDEDVSDALAKSVTKQGMTIDDRGGGRKPEGRRQGRRRQDQEQATARPPSIASAMPSSRSGSRPTPRISGSRHWA